MRKKEKINIPAGYSLTKAILDILYDLGEQVPFETPFHNTKQQWRKALGAPALPMWRYRRAIKYLERRTQLKVVEKNDKKFLQLTRKGRVQTLMTRIERGFKKPVVWDCKWRLIMWDIPEKARLQRDQIRQFVKDLGFYQLQKSSYITPHPLPTSAVEYLRESGLVRYIHFLRIDKIEDDGFLKKHFGLR